MTRSDAFNIIRTLSSLVLIAAVIFAYWRLDTRIAVDLTKQANLNDSLLINTKRLETNIGTLRDSVRLINDSLTNARKREGSLRARLNYITYEYAKQREAYSKLSEDSMINNLNENR